MHLPNFQVVDPVSRLLLMLQGRELKYEKKLQLYFPPIKQSVASSLQKALSELKAECKKGTVIKQNKLWRRQLPRILQIKAQFKVDINARTAIEVMQSVAVGFQWESVQIVFTTE